jgi:hypothetical protein
MKNGFGPLSSLRSADKCRSVIVSQHFALNQDDNLGLYMQRVAINYSRNHNPMFQYKQRAQQVDASEPASPAR